MMRRFGSVSFVCVLLAGCIASSPDETSAPVVFEKVTLEGEFPALTDFRFVPDTNDFIALNRSGKMGYFRMSGNKASMLGNFLIPGVHSGADCGASSMELDPGFSQNHYFYVSFCSDPQSSSVMRYTFDSDYFSSSVLTGKEIIHAGDPLSTRSIHGAGAIRFDAQGAMLVSFGEKGRGENAQDLDNPLGKIIRIIPNREKDGAGYDIPADNPFAGGERTDDDIVFAYGLRNPWRAAFDSLGRYWIADVGSIEKEEINIAPKGGENFGWPGKEGACQDDCEGFVDPVISYTHAADHPFITADDEVKKEVKFRVAWVGMEYVPGAIDRYDGLLTGKMLYGEWYVGWIRAASVSQDGALQSDEHIGHLPFALSFNMGKDGYVYAGSMFGSVELDENGNPQFASASDANGSLWRMVLRREKDENTL